MKVRSTFPLICMLLTGAQLVANAAGAQNLSRNDLVDTLRKGGYVFILRHTSSPREAPNPETANADNTGLERQLDAEGRTGAAAMGKALRDLKIPIGDVFTSPTYRARETVKLAQLGAPTSVAELGDSGQSMQGVTEAQAAWLRTRVTQVPRTGNTIIITHMPNLARAFPEWGAGVAEGETVILRPDAKNGTTVVGRIKINEWPGMR
jgi:phosphohistidine phosphatase SixA